MSEINKKCCDKCKGTGIVQKTGEHYDSCIDSNCSCHKEPKLDKCKNCQFENGKHSQECPDYKEQKWEESKEKWIEEFEDFLANSTIERTSQIFRINDFGIEYKRADWEGIKNIIKNPFKNFIRQLLQSQEERIEEEMDKIAKIREEEMLGNQKDEIKKKIELTLNSYLSTDKDGKEYLDETDIRHFKEDILKELDK